jgi:hypothetical protein
MENGKTSFKYKYIHFFGNVPKEGLSYLRPAAARLLIFTQKEKR